MESINQGLLKPIKGIINEHKYKTRLCDCFFVADHPCINKNTCNNAHSLDELILTDCAYGKTCVFVCYKNPGYSNQEESHKICYFIHPEENKQDYYERVWNISNLVHVQKSNKEFNHPMVLDMTSEVKKKMSWEKVTTNSKTKKESVQVGQIENYVSDILRNKSEFVNIKII